MNSKSYLEHLSFYRSFPKHLSSVNLSLLSVLVGVVAGLGAIAFRGLIALFHNLFLLQRFSFEYNANEYTPYSGWGAAVILAPIIGAVIVAFLVKNFAPEARGHGVPEVMESIHYKRGIIRPIVALIKAIASALSIGSGGSVGREGPIIQIGAAFGSTLSQLIRLPTWERLTLIACGAGGGIAATFNTPVGGVLFAVELMMHEVSFRTLVPVTISTVTATYVGRLAFGQHPSFVIPALQTLDFSITNPETLVAYIIFGGIIGTLSALFIRSIYWSEDFFEKIIGGSYYRQHILGMAMVGILFFSMMSAFGHYYIEGVGYATVQNVLMGWQGPALLLLLLCMVKLLATSLTLGSGASGGVFSPSIFIGATFGGAYGIFLSHLFPGAGISPAAFAVVGMAGMVGSSTGAALASIVMIYEMTLDYNVIIPMTLTVAIAYEIRKRIFTESVYTFKLVRRGRRMPDSLETNAHFSYRAADLMNTKFKLITDTPTSFDFADQVSKYPDAEYFLLEKEGKIVGVSLQGQTPVKEFCILPQDIAMLNGLQRMHRSGSEIAVVSANGSSDANQVRGILTKSKLIEVLAESVEWYHD